MFPWVCLVFSKQLSSFLSFFGFRRGADRARALNETEWSAAAIWSGAEQSGATQVPPIRALEKFILQLHVQNGMEKAKFGNFQISGHN